MKSLIIYASLSFAAGCFGGLLNSLAVWLFGQIGITSALGVAIAPPLTSSWLYQRLVWGGIWGALFLLPLMSQRPVVRGLIYSFGPTAIQLFLIFPYVAGKGIMGLDLGSLTPLLVIFFNAVWGIAASFWMRWAGYQGPSESFNCRPQAICQQALAHN